VMRSTAGRWRRHCSSWRKTIGRVGPGWAAPGVARPERNLVGAKLKHGKRKKKPGTARSGCSGEPVKERK
jgi:hypothetical protein